MTGEVKRYPGESAVAFANRRLKAQGRTDIEWIQTRDNRLVLRHTEQRQGALDV